MNEIEITIRLCFAGMCLVTAFLLRVTPEEEYQCYHKEHDE